MTVKGDARVAEPAALEPLELRPPPTRFDDAPWKGALFAKDLAIRGNPALDPEWRCGRTQQARAHAAAVYQAIGQHVNAAAQTWPSNGRIATSTRLSVRQVRASKRLLERSGLIVAMESGGGGGRGRGRGRTTCYWLPRMAELLITLKDYYLLPHPPRSLPLKPEVSPLNSPKSPPKDGAATSRTAPRSLPLKQPEVSPESERLKKKTQSERESSLTRQEEDRPVPPIDVEWARIRVGHLSVLFPNRTPGQIAQAVRREWREQFYKDPVDDWVTS